MMEKNRALRSALEAEIAMLEQEDLSFQVRDEMSEAAIDLADLKLTVAEKSFAALQSIASTRSTDTVDQAEHPALVEHLRMRGDVTPSFIIRVLAFGKIDFFGAIIVSLTGQPFKRVQAILAEGRDMAVLALFRKAGLPADCHAVLTGALKIWRDVARGKRDCGPQEVMWSMLEQARKEVAARPGAADNDRLVPLIKAMYLELIRDNARSHALAIAAA